MRNLLKQLMDLEAMRLHFIDEVAKELGAEILISPHNHCNSFSIWKLDEVFDDSAHYEFNTNKWTSKGTFTDEEIEKIEGLLV